MQSICSMSGGYGNVKLSCLIYEPVCVAEFLFPGCSLLNDGSTNPRTLCELMQNLVIHMGIDTRKSKSQSEEISRQIG
jgi:hypothetical protein